METNFSIAWKLYETAFPKEERRTLEEQTKIMKHPNYHFEVIFEEGQFIGFLFWWDFEMFRYIDHFATSEAMRNKGFGASILNEFIFRNSKPILLEVELPNTEINKRRIAFYERLGFKLNSHFYEVPSGSNSDETIPLLLMTYPNPIAKQEVDAFVKQCHPIMF